MDNIKNSPEPLSSFLIYIESIQGKSQKTANEYFYDIRTFYRYLKIHFELVPSEMKFNLIKINDVDIEMLKLVDLNLLYEYVNFLNKVRNNSASTRARKVTAIKSFYKYLCSKAKLIEENPTAELESVKFQNRLPKYLTLDESLNLLNIIDGHYRERDYCIFTIFLNCGLRLAELVGINISDIKDDKLTVTGKGNKERIAYLNDACIDAINMYLPIRLKVETIDPKEKALFLSQQRKRMCRRNVQTLVEKYIKKLGLDPREYTTHKLRHTAATLMYQSGVDVRVLQEILGHKQLSTTEIYTHVSSTQAKDAINKNPLASVKKNTKKS